MKTSLSMISVLLCTMVILNSCSTSKESFTYSNPDLKNASDENPACFVQFKDGSVKNFNSLKLVTGVLVTPHLLSDDGVKIYPNEIKSYQNKDHYAVSQEVFSSGRRSFLAVETLPGFAIRIAKGKLNIYRKKYIYGAGAADEYYIQNGEDGPIQTFTTALMNQFLKDNPDAAEYFNSKKHNESLTRKLRTTAAIYNSLPMVSKN